MGEVVHWRPVILEDPVVCKCGRKYLGPNCEDYISPNGSERHAFNICSFGSPGSFFPKPPPSTLGHDTFFFAKFCAIAVIVVACLLVTWALIALWTGHG